MENKIILIMSLGIVVNLIIISFCTTCYINFLDYYGPLTHITKDYYIFNITGY